MEVPVKMKKLSQNRCPILLKRSTTQKPYCYVSATKQFTSLPKPANYLGSSLAWKEAIHLRTRMDHKNCDLACTRIGWANYLVRVMVSHWDKLVGHHAIDRVGFVCKIIWHNIIWQFITCRSPKQIHFEMIPLFLSLIFSSNRGRYGGELFSLYSLLIQFIGENATVTNWVAKMMHSILHVLKETLCVLKC